MLCTPNKTFQLRQVQTSNSVFITQPTLEAHGNETATPTTCAIASCTATLELHPADGSAVVYLEDELPVYDWVGGEVDVTENHKTKARLFSHIPLSDGQCEQGWAEVVAFELAGSAYRPSANTLWQIWASINAAALAEGVQLDSQFIGEDLAKLVEEEGFPASLAMAVFRHVGSADQATDQRWCCLDRRNTVAFVGKTLLASKHATSECLIADFLENWKDALPETWRADAELETIVGSYDFPSTSTIRAKSAVSAPKVDAANSKATAAKGKWHERFAKSRKK